MKHILVLGAQVPFVRGGAEIFNEVLVEQINKIDGIKAELVQLPFKWYPEPQILNAIMAWRLLDLNEAAGTYIDLVIPTKFPTYAVQHPNKVLWLVHQHRVLYDLEQSEYDSMHCQPDAKIIRNKIRELDNVFLHECQNVFTIAETVSNRLEKYNNFHAPVLYPPPKLVDHIIPGAYGDYILYIGRLDKMKRVDLLINALVGKKTKAVIVGTGPESDRLQELVVSLNLRDNCRLTGYVTDKELLEYLAQAKAVFYAPVDEDYGYATIEAFLAEKPVITCCDSGEVEKIVTLSQAGIVCNNTVTAVAEAVATVDSLSASDLVDMGVRGRKFAEKICWDIIIQRLVLDNLK